MNRMLMFFILILSVLIFSAAFADSQKLSDKHIANGLGCIDCHGVAEPTTKASAKKCLECHNEMQKANEVEFKDTAGKEYKLNPHNAHPGQLRCTLCHSGHKESTLYCNTCHKNFVLMVP